jgi:hypothetical protein
MPRSAPRSRRPLRRLERAMVGSVMAVIAVVLERLVVRALRKKGHATSPSSEPTQVTTRGGAIEFDPEP